MKKFASILIIVLAISPVFAQKTNNKGDKQKKSPEEIATIYTDKLEKFTGLSPEQKSKVYDLKLKEVNDVRALTAQKDLKGDGLKRKVKEVKKAFRTELKELLTKEQLKKMKDTKADAEKGKKNDKKNNKGKKNEGCTEDNECPGEDLE